MGNYLWLGFIAFALSSIRVIWDRIRSLPHLKAFLLLLLLGANSASYAIDSVRNIGFALPGILFEYNGSPILALSSLNKESTTNPFTLQDVKNILSNEWDIHSRVDLLRRIDWLINNGSDDQYQYLLNIYKDQEAAFLSLPKSPEANINEIFTPIHNDSRALLKRIWTLYNDLESIDIRRLTLIYKMKRWFNISPVSLKGWDYARVVALCRWGFDIGYLERQEALEIIDSVGTSVANNFSTWTRYVENYTFGRFFEYANRSDASVLFRDDALLWWQLIDEGGAWSNIELEIYEDKQNNILLQLFKDLYFFHKALRAGNIPGINSFIDRQGALVAPALNINPETLPLGAYSIAQVPLDQPNYRHIYPVTLAVMAQENRIVNILLNNAFTSNELDRQGRSPLHWAALLGTVGSVNTFLEQGQDPLLRDLEGNSPLALAARYNTSMVMYTLLRNPRSSATVLNDAGDSLLHLVVRNEKYPNSFGILLQQSYAVLNLDVQNNMGRTALMEAAILGRTELILTLLQRGANPNLFDNKGYSALHFAAEGNFTNAARLLIAEDISVNHKDNTGKTALMLAAEKGSAQVINILLNAGADIRVADAEGRQALHFAAGNSYAISKILLERGAQPSIKGSDDWRPLHYAANSNEIETVQLLLDLGAEIDPFSYLGYTPMMLAIRNGHYELTKLLLERGANLGAYTEAVREADIAWTALNLAARHADYRMVWTLVEAGADTLALTANKWTTLHFAARYGSAETVSYLLDKGIDINALTDEAVSALMLASQDLENGAEKLRALIANGASINDISINGRTALADAAYYGNYEAVRILLNNKALIEAGKEPALVLAAQTGQYEIVKLLLQRGADVNARNSQTGVTALHYAVAPHREETWAKLNTAEIAGLLIANGAYTNIADKNGNTPLFWAALQGDLRSIKLLLDNAANPYAINNLNLSPFIYALENEYAAASYFIDYIPIDDLNKEDASGVTPLERVARLGNRRVLNLLIAHGALVNRINKEGFSPLFFSIFAEDQGNISTLIRAGARTDITDKNNDSILIYALKNNISTRNISTLLNWVQVEARDEDRNTALHLAVQYKRKESLVNLLRAGAEVNVNNDQGDTALHLAVRANAADLVQILLENNADPNKINKLGETPLQVASELGYTAIYDELRSFGASIFIRTKPP